MDAKNEVIRYLSARRPLPGATEPERLSCRYLEAGIVDSMGMVEMISHLEDTLGIRFETDDLQDERFQTVGGLIEIVERLAAK